MHTLKRLGVVLWKRSSVCSRSFCSGVNKPRSTEVTIRDLQRQLEVLQQTIEQNQREIKLNRQQIQFFQRIQNGIEQSEIIGDKLRRSFSRVGNLRVAGTNVAVKSFVNWWTVSGATLLTGTLYWLYGAEAKEQAKDTISKVGLV